MAYPAVAGVLGAFAAPRVLGGIHPAMRDYKSSTIPLIGTGYNLILQLPVNHLICTIGFTYYILTQKVSKTNFDNAASDKPYICETTLCYFSIPPRRDL